MNSIVDSQILYAHRDKTVFPRIRICGSFGYGLLAFCTGVFLDWMGGNLDLVFWLFSVLCVAGGWYWWWAHQQVVVLHGRVCGRRSTGNTGFKTQCMQQSANRITQFPL